METTTIEWEYLSLLEEEGYTVKELPTDLKNRITALKMEYGRYEKNPSEDKLKAVKTKDVKLANDILNWIEEKLPTEEEYLEAEAAKNNPPAEKEPEPVKEKTPTAEEIEAKRKEEEKAEEERKEKEKQQQTPPASSSSDIEAQIIAKTQEHPNKWISTADLAAIIGKQPGLSQKVGSLNLEKKWMQQFYYID